VGCTGVFFDAERARTSRKPKGTANYAGMMCAVLQKMKPIIRQKVISAQLTEKQRLALEAYMISQKRAQKCTSGTRNKLVPAAAQSPALDDAAPADHNSMKRPEEHILRRNKSGGIFKSACKGHVYGYYAKAGFRNLALVTRIQRKFADAVQDHVILSHVLEQVRSKCLEMDFPPAVTTATEAVLGNEGVAQHEFLRFYSVSFSARQWLGRQLFVQCDQLAGALEVWKLFNDAKCSQPLMADQQSLTDLPQRAEVCWRRMWEVLAKLRTARGTLHRSQVEKILGEFEVRRHCALERVSAVWRRQHEQRQRRAKSRAKINQEALLLQRFKQIRCRWERATEKEEQRQRMDKLRESKKRRWDGKESMMDFTRRIRCRTHGYPRVDPQ